MRYTELIQENDDTDAELFGRRGFDKLRDRVSDAFGTIYDYGDDGLEYLNNTGELYNQLFAKYNDEGDPLAAVLDNEPQHVIAALAQELEAIANDLEYELEESAEPDEELFGQKQGFVSPAEARKLSDAMYRFLHKFANDREMREWRADEPDRYGAVEFDLYLAYQNLRHGNVIKAIAALERNPMGHDIDEWAMNFIEQASGIDMRSAVGLDDDDDMYDLVRKASNELPPVELNESAESDDDDLFGPAASGVKGIIYRVGKQILSRLEQSWADPAVQREYKEYEDDADARFDQLVRLTRVKFKHAFVVDTIIREFTSMEGLNDWGWMLEQGQFNDLVDAWERFRTDPDIESEDWFQREVQDFKGDR